MAQGDSITVGFKSNSLRPTSLKERLLAIGKRVGAGKRQVNVRADVFVEREHGTCELSAAALAPSRARERLAVLRRAVSHPPIREGSFTQTALSFSFRKKQRRTLDSLNDRAKKPGGIGAVNPLMIEAKREVCDAPNGDGTTPYDRPLARAMNAEDPKFGRVQNRSPKEAPEFAKRSDCKYRAAELVGWKPPGSRPFREALEFAREVKDRRLFCAAHDGHKEALVGINSDANWKRWFELKIIAFDARRETRKVDQTMRNGFQEKWEKTERATRKRFGTGPSTELVPKADEGVHFALLNERRLNGVVAALTHPRSDGLAAGANRHAHSLRPIALFAGSRGERRCFSIPRM